MRRYRYPQVSWVYRHPESGAICRVVMDDLLGTIVEVFPIGTPWPIPETVRTIAVMRINYAALQRRFEKLGALTAEERPFPVFLFKPNALAGIELAEGLVEVAKGSRDHWVLPFRQAKRPRPQRRRMMTRRNPQVCWVFRHSSGATCRVVMVDRVGTIVEVFPMGTPWPIPETTRTIAIMRINRFALKRDCERLGALTAEERPFPVFLFEPGALSTIMLAESLVAIAKGSREGRLLPFRQAKPRPVTRRVKRPKIPR